MATATPPQYPIAHFQSEQGSAIFSRKRDVDFVCEVTCM